MCGPALSWKSAAGTSAVRASAKSTPRPGYSRTSGNGNNRTGFADPDYDALIGRAAQTLDPVERMQLLHEAEDWILNKETIILPLYYYVVQNLYDEADFSGVGPNLLNLVSLKAVKPLRGHRGRPREVAL